MNYLVLFFGRLFKFLFRFKRFIPGSVAGLFLFWEFLSDLGSHGLDVAFDNLSESILACEMVINENVNLALSNSFEYGLGAFFEIVTSVFILYTLVVFLVSLYKFFMSNDVAKFGVYLVAFFMVGVIELSYLKANGIDNFYPFYDGLFFLLVNFAPVINNIFGSSSPILVNASNSSNFTSHIPFLSLFGKIKFKK